VSAISTNDLADQLAITRLLHQCAQALDMRDWELMQSAFTPDGTADYGAFGGRHTNGPELVGFLGDAVGHLTATHHLVGNILIEVDEDTAVASSYVHAQHTLDGRNFTIGGAYEDELVRDRDGWKIKARALAVRWTDGDPGVMQAP
jgi:hypothetical protein